MGFPPSTNPMGFVPGATPVQGFPVVTGLPADERAVPAVAAPAAEAFAGTPGFIQLMQAVALGIPSTPA